MKGTRAALSLASVLAWSLAAANAHADDSETVTVHGTGWSSPRGVGDVRVSRDRLEASPRQTTSEMLSAAPGFFVDHEDGEGLGNDVYLRGFDVEHGSGIEMRLGLVPINIPIHIHGQGYADANFIIPEVVRSIRVLEGAYDPRQGDAAIVGSAYFDLGVPERGFQLRSAYGSFGQSRLVAIAAPREADEETFVAFAVRKTNGFGESRASRSGSINAQYGVDLGDHDHLRVLATAYDSSASLAGVVRQDDVDAGRIGYYGSYPFFAQSQGVKAQRLLVGVNLDHLAPNGTHFEIAPWLMATNFRARQNFAGALETSQIDPSLSGLGDLFETTNRETAVGLTARAHSAPWHLANGIDLVLEPGLTFRAGATDQTKSLLVPSDLAVWDRRVDAGLTTFDTGGYVDADLRIARRLRISGGARVDVLGVLLDDHLSDVNKLLAKRSFSGIAPSPRITAEYALTRELTPVLSYGEGFRSLDVERLTADAKPYSKVRSAEAGLRASLLRERFTTTVAAFETWVENEQVFEAEAGGLETESASIRRGVVASMLARPWSWLLASTALSVTTATFDTLVAGVSHYVPNVPPILFRTDLTARGSLAKVGKKALIGRIGAGYTYLAKRHFTDAIEGPATHALNVGGALRYDFVELGIDAYNVLGLRYADDAQVYVSNWEFLPTQQRASVATHLTAAPPTSVLGTVSLYF